MNRPERDSPPPSAEPNMRALDAAATPFVDWYLCWTQWTLGLGVALFPRGEHGVEFAVGPCVLTLRWKHGWRRSAEVC